jgi:hypothetical protein
MLFTCLVQALDHFLLIQNAANSIELDDLKQVALGLLASQSVSRIRLMALAGQVVELSVDQMIWDFMCKSKQVFDDGAKGVDIEGLISIVLILGVF